MMTLIYGLTELGRRSGETNLMVVGVGLGLAAVLLTVLYRHEVRTRDPVIEMDLVTRREFVPVNILSLGIQVGHLGCSACCRCTRRWRTASRRRVAGPCWARDR